jgi:hypothetical protein
LTECDKCGIGDGGDRGDRLEGIENSQSRSREKHRILLKQEPVVRRGVGGDSGFRRFRIQDSGVEKFTRLVFSHAVEKGSEERKNWGLKLLEFGRFPGTRNLIEIVGKAKKVSIF